MQYYKSARILPILALLVCSLNIKLIGIGPTDRISTDNASTKGFSINSTSFDENLIHPVCCFSPKKENALRHTPRKGGYKIRTIVLDAGHGGQDPGCVGKISKEKDVALAIVLRLGQLLEKNHPDLNIVYTRKTDVFIPLHERARIANRNKADLFISVHCNAVDNTQAKGTETFVLGLHRAKDNLDVAKRENAAILFEDDYEDNYEGYDPNSDEGHIMMSLFQNAYIDQSIHLAFFVENEFKQRLSTPSRGVKQAGFLVLRNAAMPSILVEAGFLTNPDEEKVLASASGQIKVAESLYQSFLQYQKAVEIKDNPVISATPSGSDVEIYVQLGLVSSDNPEKNTFSKHNLNPIRIINEDGYFKFQYGPFQSKEIAMDQLQRVKTQGLEDAFIVGYKEGKKLKLSEL